MSPTVHAAVARGRAVLAVGVVAGAAVLPVRLLRWEGHGLAGKPAGGDGYSAFEAAVRGAPGFDKLPAAGRVGYRDERYPPDQADARDSDGAEQFVRAQYALAPRVVVRGPARAGTLVVTPAGVRFEFPP